MSPAREFTAKIIATCHTGITVLTTVGWIVPDKAWLVAYLVYLPLMVAHWRCFEDRCILTVWEDLLRYGKSTPSFDGSATFVGRMLKVVFKYEASYNLVNIISHCIPLVSWVLAASHLWLLLN